VLLALVAIPATSILIDTPAAAQEGNAGSLLKTGLEQVRAGKYKEGIATLRKALAADPSSDEVMDALGRAEYEALLAVMASGQEGRLVVAALLDRAMPVLPAQAFDPEKLAGLIKTAVESDNEADRFDASSNLARVYGEFAVPGLLAYLKGSNTDHRIQAHITLQNRIGRDAVLPLNEALQSADPGVRRLVAIQLGNIGDMRSLPALTAAAAGDKDDGVRKKAMQSLEKLTSRYNWATGLSASQLYLRLAKMYYDGNYRVLARADKPIVIWRWDKGLKSFSAPRHLYVLKLAEEAAYDAIEADENNTAAAAMLARVLAAERIAAAAAAVVAEDDESLMAAAKGLADITGVLAGLGWNTLTEGLADSLAQDDHGTAASLLSMMHHCYSGADFGGDHPVVLATSSNSMLVRLEAAEAVLRFNGMRRIGAWPSVEGFMGLVAKAAGEVIPRNILVVDANDNRRNKMIDELNKAKLIVYGARSGSDGYVRSVRLAGIDMIVFSSDLNDMEALELIAKLKASDLTKDVPLVIVGSGDQVGADAWRNLYKDKVAGLAPVPEGPGLPTKEFLKIVNDSFGEEAPGAKARYAASSEILGALAQTDTDNGLFAWDTLSPTLIALLKADLPGDVPVRMNALRALANVHDLGTLDELATYFAAESDASHKAAAALAVASVCRAHGVTMSDDVFNKLLDGTGSGDAGVRLASFAALGSSQLTPAQMRAVAMRNRPQFGGGGGDE
jgi:HEAT repeat protein/CheY-like chemotaxis protein